MSVGVEVLNLSVVCPLVRDVKGGQDGTAVGVQAVRGENVAVQVLVQIVDGIVKR